MKIVICTNHEMVGLEDHEEANDRADQLLCLFEDRFATEKDLDCDFDDFGPNWRGGKYAKSHVGAVRDNGWVSVGTGVVVAGASSLDRQILSLICQEVDENGNGKRR